MGQIRQAYKKTEYFDEIFLMLDEIYQQNYELAAEMNLSLIKAILKKLHISTEVVLASREGLLNLSASHSGNELVLKMAQHFNPEIYISGTGCRDFIEPATFEDKGIKFYFQDFVSPTYGEPCNEEKFCDNLYNKLLF